MYEFFFGVYPYLCLTILGLGLLFRYLTTPGEWNARSSNLFAKKSLVTGSYIFHYAIILTFFGHFFGLLTPAWVMGALGVSYKAHLPEYSAKFSRHVSLPAFLFFFRGAWL